MEVKINYEELYRQNYQDALDEVRNLRYQIKELEKENHSLKEEIHDIENFRYVLRNFSKRY